MEREAVALRCITHPNVIKFQGQFEFGDGNAKSPKRFCIVMEYAAHGSLEDRIADACKRASPFDKRRVKSWLLDLARALHHLHDKCRIFHRDLKTQNLLLDADDNIKICDFGLACVVASSLARELSRRGTTAYMSPTGIK